MESAICDLGSPRTTGKLHRRLFGALLVILGQLAGSGFALAAPGDLNDDGLLDAADIMLMQRLVTGDDLSGLSPAIDPDDLVADLAPYDVAQQVATPDGTVNVSDLIVLMARIRAGDVAIAQAPGPAELDAVDPMLLAPNEIITNPLPVSGTTDANTVVELVVNGVVQQQVMSDASGVFAFDVYLNANAAGVTDSVLVRAVNQSGSGIPSSTAEFDYFDPVVRQACIDDNGTTTSVPLQSSPNQNGITLSNGQKLVITRGVDENCTNPDPVFRTYGSTINVNTGSSLVFMPGSELAMSESAQPIWVDAGELLMLGLPSERVIVRGDVAGTDQFSGFRITDSQSVRIEYADILNAAGSSNSYGLTIGDGPSAPPGTDTSVASILGSYVGYRDLFDPVTNPIITVGVPKDDWKVSGVYISPGTSVSITDSEIVGGGPVNDSSANPGISLTKTGGEYNVSVEGTTIALFSQGIDISEAGINDPGEVPTSVRIFGGTALYANHNGIRVTNGSRAHVDGAIIRGNCRGYTHNDGAPLIENNTISGNLVGIELQAGTPPAGQRLPVVRLNDLSGNGSVASIPPFPIPMCSGPGATVSTSLTRESGSSDFLDLTQNYWDETDAAAVLSKVTVAITADPDEVLPFDVSEFTDGLGGSVVGPISVVSRRIFDLKARASASADDYVIRPVDGETAILEFTTPVDLGTENGPRVRVQVFNELTYSAAPTGSGERSVVLGDTDDDGVPNNPVGPGTVTWIWDGRRAVDDAIVPDEAYVFHVAVENVGAGPPEIHPAEQESIAGKILYEDLSDENLNGAGADLDPIRVFSGEPLAVTFKVDPPGGVSGRAARIVVYADELNALNDPQDDGCKPGPGFASAENIKIGEVFMRADTVGTMARIETFEFPFRNSADGHRLLVQQPGIDGRPDLSVNDQAICIGANATHDSVTFVGDNKSLFEPYIIVRGTSPEITGVQSKDDLIVATPPRIRVEPYIVQRSYDQIVHFDLCLSQEANVTFQIMDRDEANPAGYATTPKATLSVPAPGNPLPANSCTGGDFHHFTWDASDQPEDGIITFIIDAVATRTDLSQPTTTYRGFLDLRP